MKAYIITLFLFLISIDAYAASITSLFKKKLKSQDVYHVLLESQKEYGVTVPTDLLDHNFDRAISHYEKIKGNSELMSLNIYSIKNHPALRVSELDDIEVKLESAINSFVEKHPDKIAPYLYRAAYYYQKGRQARSTAFASEVTYEKFERMRHYFRKGLADLDKAASIDGKNINIFLLRIEMKKYSPKELGDYAEDLEIASSIEPYNYDLWEIKFNLAEPKWGGSEEEIDRRASEVRRLINANPKLTDFLSYKALLIGYYLQDNNKYDKSLKVYSEVYDLGNQGSRFLSNYSYVLRKKKQKNLACKIARESIESNPSHWFANYRRAECGKSF